ncbi:MAG: ABC transporter permease, partial [Geminicoccaceae bacterium]|nr:ABC transporter permease [Geminicoccaceae bacterium]
MTGAEAAAAPLRRSRGGQIRYVARLLAADKFALAAFVFLVLMILAAAFGPILLPEASVRMNLALRNAPPFVFENGIAYLLGGDSLGRPILPRLLVAARTTLMIAVAVVICSATIGATLGLIAGYYGRWLGTLIMRFADVVMSFPSLLLAVLVLYVLDPRAANVIIVLAITRMPVFIRVTRAEVLEIKERLFVEGARAAGASDFRIMTVHVLPVV